MITEIKGTCQYENCDKPATDIAAVNSYSDEKEKMLGVYCLTHAKVIQDNRSPEYHDTCPNCGCMFGVN